MDFSCERKQENSEKHLSQTWEEQKTEENGSPNIGKTEKSRKMLSQDWENQKISKAAFSNPWKNKKYCWELFQFLGRAIFLIFHSSEALDGQFF